MGSKKSVAAVLLLCIAVPGSAEARHRNRIDRSSLDTEVVESFSVPVLFGVDYNKLVPDFGDPRGGGTRSHEGQDMLAPKGTPIVSPTEAVVISTGSGESSGKYVYTANPGGESFRYMHLDAVANIDPGDVLKVGDFIGTVGDTGNAPDGVYHLHFETRDSDGAQDPYPRMTDSFTLKEKITFLDKIFDDRTVDDDKFATFLVETFPNDFRQALAAGYDVPRVIEVELRDSGVTTAAEKLAALESLLKKLPVALGRELRVGDSGPEVVLLQLYLMYLTEGTARDSLLAAGATGYYGSVTAGAVSAYQATHSVAVTGVYDSVTRAHMIQNDEARLSLAL